MPTPKRVLRPRLIRNEGLLPPLTIELTDAEKAWIETMVLSIPLIARIKAEEELLTRVRRSRRVTLKGSDRFWIIARTDKKATNRSLSGKVRGQ